MSKQLKSRPAAPPTLGVVGPQQTDPQTPGRLALGQLYRMLRKLPVPIDTVDQICATIDQELIAAATPRCSDGETQVPNGATAPDQH